MCKRSHSWARTATLLMGGLVLVGCGESNRPRPHETTRGLQEENRVLEEKISHLESRIRDQHAAHEQQVTQLQAQIETIKKQHEADLARERELHEKAAAQLRKESSSLRLKLGVVERENLALSDIVDRSPRIEEARQARMGADVWVLVVLLLLSLIGLLYFVFRYRSACDRLNFLAMQCVSEFRRIGGGNEQCS